LQQAEVGPAAAADGYDLAVGDEALFRPDRSVREFRVARGHVVAVAANEPDLRGIADDQRPNAVPFEFDLPVLVREVGSGPRAGQHRAETGGIRSRAGGRVRVRLRS